MEITKTGTEKSAATMNRFFRSLIRRCAGVVSSAGSRCSFSARRASSSSCAVVAFPSGDAPFAGASFVSAAERDDDAAARLPGRAVSSGASPRASAAVEVCCARSAPVISAP